MWDILYSNDAVVMNFAQAVLRQAGIASFVADEHISIVEGSIGAFPRRLQVPQEDWRQARVVLEEAGLSSWLLAEGEGPG
ncbi:MAG: DUF2007 domain-containing protein [Hyphomicrobiaceae bacterium]|nr:DUF2007 domain-containing protein [Hyphomicrobiaceae bacterium]